MNEQEFLEKYGEFRHLFNIVEEPTNSKEKLISFQDKFGLPSYLINWYYKIQGFDSLKEFMPEVEDWVYYYERFLRYGGNPDELKEPDDYIRQALENEETSDSLESLVLFFNSFMRN